MNAVEQKLRDLPSVPAHGVKYGVILALALLLIAAVVVISSRRVSAAKPGHPKESRRIHATDLEQPPKDEPKPTPAPVAVARNARNPNAEERRETAPVAVESQPAPKETAPSPEAEAEVEEETALHLRIAIWFGGLVLATATLVALVSFFVYLFSRDNGQSRKAGGIFKTAFGFLVTTGAGVMAYLGFGK